MSSWLGCTCGRPLTGRSFDMMNDVDRVLQIIDSFSCCDLVTVSIERLAENEGSFFSGFMPQAATAIVLGHHVITEEEWTWYATPNGGEHCAADDHLLGVCRAVKAELEQSGHEVKIVEYPRQSGLQFRYVAQAAGLGQIAKNAFLIHPEWGPWVHLRVMATSAALSMQPRSVGAQGCDQCGLCIEECPANAISDDGFEGLQCRAYRKERGEYEPCGDRGELRYCLRCAWVCPQGPRPVPRSRPGTSVEPAAQPDTADGTG
jgi:epoxyqueuosine reductase